MLGAFLCVQISLKLDSQRCAIHTIEHHDKFQTKDACNLEDFSRTTSRPGQGMRMDSSSGVSDQQSVGLGPSES